MLPEFDANGNLPPGVHVASVSEVLERFSRSGTSARLFRTRSLRLFIDLVGSLASALYIDGSYITEKLAPNDVDIAVVLSEDFAFTNLNLAAFKRLERQFKELDIYPRKVNTPQLSSLVDFWCKDRDGNPKGIVYVELQE